MITRRTICLLAIASATLAACAGRSTSTVPPTTAPPAAPAAGAERDPAVVPQGAAAATAGSGATVSAAGSKRMRSGPITGDELTQASIAGLDAYGAIQRLRPSFLTGRASTSLRGAGGGILVSVDRSPPESLSILRSIRASEILEIRFLSASEAGQQFGTAARNAAVLVVTRR